MNLIEGYNIPHQIFQAFTQYQSYAGCNQRYLVSSTYWPFSGYNPGCNYALAVINKLFSIDFILRLIINEEKAIHCFALMTAFCR